MAFSEEKQQIEKLKGKENWSTWRYLLKTVLECDGTLDVCTGKLVKPVSGASNYDTELDTWQKANLKAKKRLVITLEMKPLLRVEGCDTANEIWDKLHDIYDVHSAENIDLLRHQFHSIKWDWEGGIAGH